MLTLGASPRVFVATEPIEMRGAFDVLGGHLRRLYADPFDVAPLGGGLFLLFG